MKHIYIVILLFVCQMACSQNAQSDKNLEDYFKAYSKAIIEENVANELQLIHPALFENSSKEETIEDYLKMISRRDTTQIKKTNKIIAIKNISDPIKKRNIEYRIIDYIIITEIVFKKKLYDKMRQSDSINKTKRWYNKSIYESLGRRDTSIQPLSFDQNAKIGIYSYHKRIIAVREPQSKQWWFISDKWCDLTTSRKAKRNLAWRFNYSSQICFISDIDLYIPKDILKAIKKPLGYNSVYH
ncbi:hypothetical protein KORDIASMS9_02823 [Kordia sp. SMS9]|uniref:hypothetical protein n=1 Tax=Kordia sp. SMS9 TaxID=2282170 RepID=UPI000E109E81|nr:hypothetical protein [Kordia sp. SMS9]AXG70583.1 hypothetical protein KORDIASMS9_02823 [Kordia sp. SMS9]